MRYYLSTNVAVPVDLGGERKLEFEAAEFFTPTNSWWGVYATEDPAEIEALEAAVEKKVIQSCSERDFKTLDLKKKKLQPSNPNLIDLRRSPQPVSPTQKDAAPAVVAEAALESVEDALTPQKPTRRVSASVRKVK